MAAPLRSCINARITTFQPLVRQISPFQIRCLTNHYGKAHRKRRKDQARYMPGGPSTPKVYNYLRPGSIVGESKNTPQGSEILTEAQYPPIKPKFPPGSWGTLNRDYAWMWDSLKNELISSQTVMERIHVYLQCQNEADAVFLEPFNDHPSCLPFRQFVTKTHSIPWAKTPQTLDDNLSAPVQNNTFPSLSADLHGNLQPDYVETVIDKVKQAITDHFLIEKEIVIRDNDGDLDLDSQAKLKCKYLFRHISDTIATNFWRGSPHLRFSQYDEDVTVRALWHRNYIERQKPDIELQYKNVDDLLGIVSKMDQTVISSLKFDAMLRGHVPLPEIEAIDSDICTQVETPLLAHKNTSYGHNQEPRRQIQDICAGYKLGDPCEFGLVGFLSTCESNAIEEKYNLKVAEQMRLAFGLTSSFTWLAAQAFNQGFSDVVDVTYPLVSQTVLSDGRRFSFLKYQLNTLALWQDNQANSMVNLCWHTKEMPLYHSVEEGHVRELNDDVVRHLVEMFLVAPVDRGYDLKPTVPKKDVDLHLKSDFVPERIIVEVIEEEEQYIVTQQ